MQKKVEKDVVFPFWEGIIFPFETIYKKVKDFCCLIGVFSLIAAVLVMAFGRSFACALGLNGWGIYCMVNPWGMLLLFVLLLFLMACFVNRWWMIAFKGMGFAEVIKIKPDTKDIKVLGFLLVYLVIFLIVGGGLYLLYSRTATPDLKLELAIFVGVSLVIVMSLVLLLNAVVFARFLEGEEWFVIRQTLLPLFDNIYKIVAWFLFYLLFFAYLMRQAGSLFFVLQRELPLFISSFLSEFALQFVFYLVAACVVSLLKLQADCIFKDRKSTDK